jgi:hypothetical protein
VFSGALQALINGSLSYILLEKVAMTSHGYMSDVFLTGTVVLGFSVYNSTFKVILFSNTYTIAVVSFLAGSIGVYLLTFEVISSL